MRMTMTITGPSCSGKSHLAKLLLEQYPGIFATPKSTTTREPRFEGESEYHFVTTDEFAGMIESGELLEFTTFQGDYYGTPLKEITDILSEGKVPLLVVDPAGREVIQKRGAVLGFDTFAVYIEEKEHLLVKRWLERLQAKPESDLSYIASRIISSVTEESCWGISHTFHRCYYDWSKNQDKVIRDILAYISESANAA